MALATAERQLCDPSRKFHGIVGSSGSGKSTMLKMLTRLLIHWRAPFASMVTTSARWTFILRSQIEWCHKTAPLDGTVQANIALSKPDASFEEISSAAQVACAHDFIQALPGAIPAC